MRGRVVLAAVLGSVVVVPAAHAASVTLTSPPNGAVYYTGGAVAAKVPVSATRDLSGCTNGPSTYWSVPFLRDGAPAGGANSTNEGALSATVLVQPGNYTARANSPCGGAPTLFSATHSFRVVSGTAPPKPPVGPSKPPTGTKPVYPKVKKTKCTRKGKRVLCPQQKALVSRLVKAAKQTAKQRVPLKQAAAKRKAAKTPAQRDAAGKAVEAVFKPIADAYINLLVLSKKPLPTVKVNLPRTQDEWKRLLLPVAEKQAEKKWGDKRLYTVYEFGKEADKTLALTSKYAAETDRRYVAEPGVRAELDALAPALCDTTFYSQCGAAGKAAVISHGLVQTGQEHKLHNQASDLSIAGAKVVLKLPRGF